MEVDQEGSRREPGDQNENLDDEVTAGTTEYAANSEAADGGSGYVEGEDLPTEGRDDAPQG